MGSFPNLYYDGHIVTTTWGVSRQLLSHFCCLQPRLIKRTKGGICLWLYVQIDTAMQHISLKRGALCTPHTRLGPMICVVAHYAPSSMCQPHSLNIGQITICFQIASRSPLTVGQRGIRDVAFAGVRPGLDFLWYTNLTAKGRSFKLLG